MKVLKSTCALLLLSFAVQANEDAPASDNYTVTLNCTDTQQNPKKSLELKVNPLAQSAVLLYEGSDSESTRVAISKPHGIYSSSDVSIHSSSYGGLRSLSISASMNEVFRITSFVSFNLQLEEGNDGVFKASFLSTRRGTDAYPKQTVYKEMQFENMSCSIMGL